MPRTRSFAQVDVFAETPYLGNPLAVVLDGAGLSDEDMGRFAAWTNLSETTFVQPPSSGEADYRLRIFTPSGELPFAGHPTLGSAHAWLEAGGVPKSSGTPETVVQECGLGLVEVRRSGTGLAFRAPPLLRTGPLDDDLLDRIADGLRIPRDQIIAHQWVDNGPGWAAVQLPSANEVLALKPNAQHLHEVMLGVVGAYPEGSPAQFEVRAFAVSAGVDEDPVTGSLNASLAQWLIGNGTAPPSYTASQGACLGRRGIITVQSHDGEIWVGGNTITCIHGAVHL